MNPGCAGCPVASGSGRVADGPARALTAAVHDQVGVAGRGPEDPLVGEPATAAVADVFDHRGKRLGARDRQVEPAPDRGATEAGEGHVECLEDGQSALDRLEGRIQVVASSFGQGRRPELIQVRRHGQIRRVRAELGQREVVLRHRWAPSVWWWIDASEARPNKCVAPTSSRCDPGMRIEAASRNRRRLTLAYCGSASRM